MNIQAYKEKIKKAYENSIDDQYRLKYHLMPLSGTLADPNGMCQVNDTYHIYYVHNPIELQEKQRVPSVWGHYTTKDFIHYKREPIAIFPDHPRDKDGVYSGSMLIENQTFYAFYTGNVRYKGEYDYIMTGREQNVILVTSQDGVHFDHKQVIMTNEDFPSHMTKHVRDPQIIKDNDKYYIVLGARDIHDKGCILIYESLDLYHFKFMKELSTKDTFGYMWECPDMIKLGDTLFLIACPQGIKHEKYRYQNAHQCGYFLVDDTISRFEQFDYGFDFYAARTFLDAKQRRILVGWMGMSEASYSRTLTSNNNWDQAIAMPRVLTCQDHHIYQQPLPEMKKLRKDRQYFDPKKKIIEYGCLFELIIRLNKQQDIQINLREDCMIYYDCSHHELILSMDLCGDGRKERKIYLDSLDNLQIFSDTSSLEIFINDGYATMTSRIFGESKRIEVHPFDGGVELYRLDSFTIENNM